MRAILPGVLALAAATAVAAPERGLEIYWVDVEGGGATLVVTPARESVLIDTGFPGDRDANRIHRVATQAAGLTRIDHVIVTHFHIDHFGGLASLARLMPVGTLHERYLASAPDAERAQPQLEAYKKLAIERRSVVQPGGQVELKAEPGTAPVRLEFLGASGQFVEPRAPGGNALCKPQPPREPDPSDNKNSVVSLVTFGRFRFFDGGDLTWDNEAALVCPRDRVGPVDVYQSNHHASDTSNNPLLLQTLRPTVAVVNNGPRKGGEAGSLKALRELKELRGLYQVHRSLRVPDGNTDADRIANAEESCDAHFIKLSVEPDGSAYTVWVPPTGHRKSYRTRTR
jgi:beta-lactamase superfamily II metal-dependent hydrolase